MKALGKHASKADLLALLEILDAARATETHSQFRRLVERVSRLLPIDRAHISVANLDRHHRIRSTAAAINLDYPTRWLSHYREQGLMAVDPAATTLFSTSGPLIWSRLQERHTSTEEKRFFGAATEFGLREGFSYGSRFQARAQGSFFSCEGPELTSRARHTAIISYLLPHLHNCLQRLQTSNEGDTPRLTPRERQVLG